MPRVQFSDVVPPEKRSIRNIPIPNSNRRNKAPSPNAPAENSVPLNRNFPKSEKPVGFKPIIVEDTPTTPEPPTPNSPRRSPTYYHEDSFPGKKGSRKWLYTSLSVVAVLGFVVVMMTIFSSARVIVTPKSQNLSVNLAITAGPEAENAIRVPYEMIKITKTKSASVEATAEEMVEEKASGRIVVYNNFSSEPQRLIIRTRFESPEGLIYRIPESIVVPGKTANGPGQIEVQVFADEPGEKYNIEKQDFTVPGFKNDSARYKGFYAKGVTEMSGGFVGKIKRVEPNLKKSTLDRLESELRTEVEQELKLKIPAELTLVQNAIFFEAKDLPQQDTDKTTNLTKEVTGYALAFKKESLSKVLTDKYLKDTGPWQNIPSLITDFSLLKIKAQPTSIPKGEIVELELEGETLAKAKIDPETLISALAGAKRSSIPTIIDSLVGIESLKASIRPSWKRSFPERPDKIYIDIE